jgi:NIPSNAP
VKKFSEKVLGRLRSWSKKRYTLLLTALLSFLSGLLFSMRLAHLQEVHAEESRVFELMIYHTLPGKVPALESIFRDVSRQQTQYNLNVLGYWVPNEDPAWKDTFVYVVVHPSREAADSNWHALHADPSFLPYRRAAEPLIEKVNGRFNVDEVYMRPSEFSPIK